MTGGRNYAEVLQDAGRRQDLLGLSIEDLESLANRGTVKRAVAELEGRTVECLAFAHSAGALVFEWSDEIVCRIADKGTAHSATCTCDSATICRHIVRSILFYQAVCRETDVEGSPSAAEQIPWSPADIADVALLKVCAKGVVQNARKLFEAGETVEILIGVRPMARFLSLSHSVRYTVAGDVRYAVCDCPDQAPCVHAVLGVMAFRLMPEGTSWATVNTAASKKVDAEVCASLEDAVAQLMYLGLNSQDSEMLRALNKVDAALDERNYSFFQEILAEILQARKRALAGDALYAPDDMVELIAELLCRCDCAQADKGEIPSTLIVGSKYSRSGMVAKSNLLGLGTQVLEKRKSVRVIAYFQEQRTGGLVTISREYENKVDAAGKSERESYARLSHRPFLKAYSLAKLGVANVLAAGGKMSASRDYQPGRNPVSVNPQAFRWEILKAPLLFDNFSDLAATLDAEYPWYLGLRFKGKNLKVAQVANQSAPIFSVSDQTLSMVLGDAQGAEAILQLPYRSLAHDGFEHLIKWLAVSESGAVAAAKIVFVCGTWRSTGGRLIVEPVTVVFERDGRRFAVQPDVDGEAEFEASGVGAFEKSEPDSVSESAAVSASSTLAREALIELGHLIKPGLRTMRAEDARVMRLLCDQAEGEGQLLLAGALSDFIGAVGESGMNSRAIADAAMALAVVGFVAEG